MLKKDCISIVFLLEFNRIYKELLWNVTLPLIFAFKDCNLMAEPIKTKKNLPIINVEDLKVIYKIFFKNWYYFVLAPLALASLAFFYTHRMTEVYAAETQILLRNNETYNYQDNIYKNIGYLAVYGDISNQKRVLSSYDLVQRALSKVDFKISYYIEGRLKTTELYNSMPFKIDMELLNSSLYEQSIRFSIVDMDTYKLDFENNGSKFSRLHKFGEKDYTNDYIIKTIRRAELNEKSESRLKQIKYRFIVHSESFLVNKIRSSMSIDNLDFTSILSIRLEDQIAVRAKLFLDTLSHVYINYSKRSDSLLNERTLYHIGNQIDTLKSRLDTIENELEVYRKDSTILDLGKESEKFFNQWVKYDGQRRTYQLQLQSINNLENYMKNTKDHNLIPPSFYMLEKDNFLEQSLQELYTKQIQKNRAQFDMRFQHAGMQQLDSTISTMKKDILLYIEDTRVAIKQKINEVSNQTEQYAALMRRVPRRERDMLSIARENQVNEKLYVFLLEKQANTQIAKAG
ncbi:MAG: hypothetical protein HOL28_03855, partial [Crocinitomicaceae bacterium]|nr:hypothetical protein [Crocinitomicaceae bacterium]